LLSQDFCAAHDRPIAPITKWATGFTLDERLGKWAFAFGVADAFFYPAHNDSKTADRIFAYAVQLNQCTSTLCSGLPARTSHSALKSAGRMNKMSRYESYSSGGIGVSVEKQTCATTMKKIMTIKKRKKMNA
jgi:hypothetical protein